MTADSDVNPFANESSMTACRHYVCNDDAYYGPRRHACTWLRTSGIAIPKWWRFPESKKLMFAHPSMCAACPCFEKRDDVAVRTTGRYSEYKPSMSWMMQVFKGEKK